jgi:D-glycero-D-manno-heptose 1,7-bisphosphate phosphatase
MKKVIFLDRDGTINVDHGFVHKIEDWEWTSGAIGAMKSLQDSGFMLAVITNQSGIAEGLYTESDMRGLHEHMKQELEKNGVTLAAIAFCPHGRDQADCDCRKPNIGMAKQIEEKIGEIDYGNSWTIGDKLADVGFGKKAGTHTVLLRSTYWEEKDINENERPDIVADSLAEAADLILTKN